MADRSKEIFKGKSEEVQPKPRTRRTQKQVIVDKIEKTFKYKVIASVYGAEMKKIIASLDLLQASMVKKKKPKEDVILTLFSAEELENLLKQKKQMENK